MAAPTTITSATQAQLNQFAANIAQNMAANLENGVYEDVYQYIGDLAAAINCLVQYNANNTSTTLIQPSHYATNVNLSGTTICPKPR